MPQGVQVRVLFPAPSINPMATNYLVAAQVGAPNVTYAQLCVQGCRFFVAPASQADGARSQINLANTQAQKLASPKSEVVCDCH